MSLVSPPGSPGQAGGASSLLLPQLLAPTGSVPVEQHPDWSKGEVITEPPAKLLNHAESPRGEQVRLQRALHGRYGSGVVCFIKVSPLPLWLAERDGKTNQGSSGSLLPALPALPPTAEPPQEQRGPLWKMEKGLGLRMRPKISHPEIWKLCHLPIASSWEQREAGWGRPRMSRESSGSVWSRGEEQRGTDESTRRA